MKLSHPIAIKCVALLGSVLLRLLAATLDFRFAVDDPVTIPSRMTRRGVYMFWHEMMLFPACTHARRGFSMLVSLHRDGELITQVLRMFRGRTIRGSTTRGGAAAILGMLRSRRGEHLAITPDGPRGPRRIVQAGAVYLASRGRMPLIPLGFASPGCWRAPSWDRTVVARPGRPVRCVAGRPMDVPADLDREGLEQYRLRAQVAMDDVQARAERLAQGMDGETSLLTLRQVL